RWPSPETHGSAVAIHPRQAKHVGRGFCGRDFSAAASHASVMEDRELPARIAAGVSKILEHRVRDPESILHVEGGILAKVLAEHLAPESCGVRAGHPIDLVAQRTRS